MSQRLYESTEPYATAPSFKGASVLGHQGLNASVDTVAKERELEAIHSNIKNCLSRAADAESTLRAIESRLYGGALAEGRATVPAPDAPGTIGNINASINVLFETIEEVNKLAVRLSRVG